MFLTRTIFDTDPTEFGELKLSDVQLHLTSLFHLDQQYNAVDSLKGIGVKKNPMQTDPKIVERLWHNIDNAKYWINLCKDDLFNGSGLTFMTTIQEVTWLDDTYNDYTISPTVLETIRSDS